MWSVVAVCRLAAFITLVTAFENNYDPCNPNDDYYVKGGHTQLCPGTRTNPGSGVCEYTMNNNLGLDYKCVCQPGYRNYNQRQCIDIDDCLSSPCPAQSRCVNHGGSYQCECLPGYYLDKDTNTCEDIKDCSTKPEAELCGNPYGESHGDCEETPGSFKCTFTCDNQLHEDGFVADLDYDGFWEDFVWSEDLYTEERPESNYAWGGPNDDKKCVSFPVISIDTIIPIEGNTAFTLNCTLDDSWSYYHTDRIQVDWFRNGQAFKPSSTTRQEAIVKETLPPNQLSIGVHDGNFTCKISGLFSNPLTVDILHPSSPTLHSKPANGRVCIGRIEVLTCLTTNIGSVQYKFLKDKVEIVTQADETFTMNDVNASHAGIYTCVIIMNGQQSSESLPVDLIVQDTVSKIVAVEGLKLLNGVQWDDSLEDIRSVKYTELSEDISEKIATFYNKSTGFNGIRNIQFRSVTKTAVYNVAFSPASQPDTDAMDADLRQSATQTLGNVMVNYADVRHQVRPFTPCLSVLPSGKVIANGHDATFTCASQYTGPTVLYRVHKYSVTVTLTDNGFEEVIVTLGPQDTDTFTIEHVEGDDTGQYTCVVTVDGIESAVSTVIPLEVNIDIEQPELSASYNAQKQELRLTCTTSNHLMPSIKYEYKRVTQRGTFVWTAEASFIMDVLVGVDDGVYSCTTLVDGVHSTPSLPVDRKFKPEEPVLIIEPVLDAGNIPSGTRVSMYCYTHSTGDIMFKIKGGANTEITNLQKSSRIFVDTSRTGQVRPSHDAYKYVIESVKPGDEGHFQCIATSATGTRGHNSDTLYWNGVTEVNYQACTARLAIKGGLQWDENLGDFRSDEFDDVSAELTKELLKFYKKFPGFRRLIHFQFRNTGNVEVTYDVEFVKWDHMTPDMMTFDLKAEYQSTKFNDKYDIDINEISHHDKAPKQAVPEREIVYDMKLVAIILGAVIVVAITILCLNTARLVRKDAAEHRKLAKLKRKAQPKRRRISSLGTSTVPFAGIDLDRYALSGASPLSASDVRSAGHVNTSPLPPASSGVGSHGDSDIPPWAAALIRSTTEANSALVRSNHELIRPIIESNQRTEAYMRSTEAHMRAISETNTALVRSINESNNSLHSKLDRVLLTDATHL